MVKYREIIDNRGALLYKMVKKIKIFDKTYFKALSIASKIHDKLRSQVDLKNEDKKLAIYYLQGGCITHAYLAINHWLFGDLSAPFTHKRIIQELGEVALFISVLPEKHRYINSFFAKKIITLPNILLPKWRKEKEAILKKILWNEDTLKKYVQNSKLLSEGFSSAVHAQIETAAFNSDKKTGEYDYDLSKGWTKAGFIRNFDFGHYIVIPAINPLFLNYDILKLDSDDIRDLDIIDEIAKIGKDIFDNLKDSVLNQNGKPK